MKRLFSLFLCFIMLFSLLACSAKEETVTEGLRLYGVNTAEERLGGDVITATVVPWESLPHGREEQAAAVMERLLQSTEDYISPLPAGTMVRSVKLSGSTAYVDLSAAYYQLSDMALTIADYCITLSLTQLTGIYAVRIAVEGRELPYRDKQALLAGDVLLSSMDDVVRTMTAQLYFYDEEGVLTAEERLLTQYEGESGAQVVLEALLGGPGGDNLLPLLPEDFVGMTARMESGVCHLNIPADSMARLSDSEAVVDAIGKSLLSVEGIREVLLYIDGEPQWDIGTR